ncbi:MAG: cysteine-rich small domain-containing protein [Oscillospiraceae bacterium]|nr:cysteine-rich small domain-containing protein [Oscillospiraceae bacterium]MBQ7001097.1 cysteine-rich small domain-containing protein [Oscillospiraceae bacterium]
MSHYDFVQNRECEFFPCHSGVAEEAFNCLFCYCPLYPLGEDCGGSFTYTPQGIKDCSGCCRPHVRGNYAAVMEQMDKVLALAKKP